MFFKRSYKVTGFVRTPSHRHVSSLAHIYSHYPFLLNPIFPPSPRNRPSSASVVYTQTSRFYVREKTLFVEWVCFT